MIDEKLLKILENAGRVFMRYGIKSVTMDDIARELKVSKKTLYKYVKDKQELVKLVMEGHCQIEQMQCQEIIDKSENAIDEIIEITKFVSNELKQVHPSIHYDLEKYYGDAWEVFHSHKNGYVTQCILNNLERGIKEKLYRENLNPEIIARIYARKMDIVFDPAVFPTGQYKFTDIHIEMMRYHLRGVANEKGMTYLKERMKEEQINL